MVETSCFILEESDRLFAGDAPTCLYGMNGLNGE